MSLISGDQSPFWDAPLKLRVLADMGLEVVHDVHTADLFSRPPVGSNGITVTNEAYRPDGNVTRWTASVEAVPFLGRMHVSPDELTMRGVDLAKVAAHFGKPIDHTSVDLTAGDWIGLAMMPADAVAHGVSVQDFEAAFSARLSKPLRRDISAICDQPNMETFEQLFRIKSGVWPEVAQQLLRGYLDRHMVNGQVTITTSVDKFSQGVPLSLFLFVDHYNLVCEAYNDAMRSEGEYVPVLKHGDLPHYAIVKRGGVLRRTDLDYRTGDTVRSVLARVEGEMVAVVAKAVPLTIDLRAAGTLVMPVKGSAYWPKAVQFATLVEERLGRSLGLNGVMRLHFHALDALEDVDTELQLPPYLAKAFGSERVTGRQFAASWRGVVEHAEMEANRLAGEDLMAISCILEEIGELGSETRTLLKGFECMLGDYNNRAARLFASLKGGTMSKEDRAAQRSVVDREKAELDRSVNPQLWKAAQAAVLAGIDAMRARLIAEHVAVASSLRYWDVRPFTHWVEAVPGWYEGIRARAELKKDPLL